MIKYIESIIMNMIKWSILVLKTCFTKRNIERINFTNYKHAQDKETCYFVVHIAYYKWIDTRILKISSVNVFIYTQFTHSMLWHYDVLFYNDLSVVEIRQSNELDLQINWMQGYKGSLIALNAICILRNSLKSACWF